MSVLQLIRSRTPGNCAVRTVDETNDRKCTQVKGGGAIVADVPEAAAVQR